MHESSTLTTGSNLADLFKVSPDGAARRADTRVIASPSIFGGQLFGLAIVAAVQSAGGAFDPVSMHAHLLERGIAGSAIEIAVTNVRDGGSSRHRSLTIGQGGRPIASLQILLGRRSDDVPGRPGEPSAPAVASPLTGDRTSPFLSKWGFDELEVVHLDAEAIHPMWVKPRVDLPDDPALHAAAIAFVSDMALVLVAQRGLDDVRQTPLTVDHAIWFHGVPRFADWLLLDARRVARHGAHARVSATLTDPTGHLVASVSQGVRLRGSGPA